MDSHVVAGVHGADPTMDKLHDSKDLKQVLRALVSKFPDGVAWTYTELVRVVNGLAMIGYPFTKKVKVKNDSVIEAGKKPNPVPPGQKGK